MTDLERRIAALTSDVYAFADSIRDVRVALEALEEPNDGGATEGHEGCR